MLRVIENESSGPPLLGDPNLPRRPLAGCTFSREYRVVVLGSAPQW